MTGLDREARRLLLAATHDEEGREITPRARVPLRHAGDGGRQHHQRFRHAGRRPSTPSRWRPRSRRCASTAGWSTPACGRTPRPGRCGRASCTSRSSAPARPGPSSPPSCTGPSAHVVAYGLDRIDPAQGHPHHPDRGGAPDPAGAAGAHLARRCSSLRRSASTCATGAGERGARRRRAARRRRLHPVGAGGLGGRREGAGRAARISAGWRPRGPTSSWSPRPCRRRATPTSSRIGDCASCRARGTGTPVPPRAQAAHQQASHMIGQIRRRLDGKPLRAVPVQGLRLAGLARRVRHGRQPDGLRRRQEHADRGLFARLMYRSLYKMHERALHGTARSPSTRWRGRSTRRTEPRGEAALRSGAGTGRRATGRMRTEDFHDPLPRLGARGRQGNAGTAPPVFVSNERRGALTHRGGSTWH